MTEQRTITGMGSAGRWGLRAAAAGVGGLGLGVLTTASCVRINPEHCMSRGGDLGCGDQMCVMSLGEVAEDDPVGCVDAVPEGYIHLPYGLPVALDGAVDDVRTVAGLATALMCSVDPDALRDEWVELDKVRRHLEAPTRVRKARSRLEQSHVDAIRAFNEAFSNACERETTGTSSGGTETDSGDTTDGTASSSSSGEPIACMDDGDCSDAVPFCDLASGTCVGCDGRPDPDAACAELDPLRPLCAAGECVQCTPEQPASCDAELLVCNGYSNTCVACTEHDQCASGACDVFEGICFDAATVVEVGGGGAASIGVALAGLDALWPDALGQRRGVLVLHEGMSFDETATIQNGSLTHTDAQAVAFVAAPGESPAWINSAAMPSTPTLTVVGMATRVYLDGIALRNNAALTSGWGLSCNSARVDIRRSRVVANAGGSIQALGQCELHVLNSFVGGDVSDQDAIHIASPNATATILYSTLGAGFGTAAALHCDPRSVVDLRNSLLVSRSTNPELVCAGASPITSASEADGLGPMSTTWFANYAAGDFHLTAAAPDGIRVAEWQPGDPTTDIDGDPRLIGDDELDHAGADAVP